MKAKGKNQKTLSEALYESILLNLEKAMAEEKLYLRQDLCMHQLAKEIKTNTTYLSRIIKETFNTNFTAYLNSLRIGEAKKIIANHKYDNYTIDAISKECGYKNRTTFHKAFKNITGLAPDKYRKQIKGQKKIDKNNH